MDQDQYEALVAGLKRAKRAPKPYGWYFCVKGGDGKPILLVGKRAAEVKQEGREVRKSAVDKRGARGLVVVGDDGRLVFGIAEGNATSDVVERLLRTKVSLDPALKPVKGLLQKARVLEEEEFAEHFRVEDEAEEDDAARVDTSKAEKKLDDARAASKKAYDAAVARVGAKHADVLALVKLQERAKKTREEAMALLERDAAAGVRKLKDAASRYEELADSAEAAGLEDEGEETEGEEAVEVVPAKRKGPVADPTALAAVFADAMDAVNVQLAALGKKLVATGDPQLRSIAEVGLTKMTAGHRTKLQAALADARATTPDQRPKALERVAAAAGAFLDHLEDEVFELCDENPLGVKVTVRKTLGGALKKLAAAA